MAGEARRATHEALGGFLDEGELLVSWVVVAEVAGPDHCRYLVHRAGGGVDGTDAPMAWTALGMLQSGARLAEDQVAESSRDPDGED